MLGPVGSKAQVALRVDAELLVPAEAFGSAAERAAGSGSVWAASVGCGLGL